MAEDGSLYASGPCGTGTDEIAGVHIPAFYEEPEIASIGMVFVALISDLPPG